MAKIVKRILGALLILPTAIAMIVAFGLFGVFAVMFETLDWCWE